jgi:cytochrome P450
VILGEFETEEDFATFERVAKEIGAYGIELAARRRDQPTEDLSTALVQAEVDGERLSDAEVVSLFILLAAAGNETTRNAITHGLLELTRHPDQRAHWWSDFDGMSKTAVEEIVRWASPVIYMRRRVMEDTVVGGQQMRAGDKVAMWYASANRDEAHFAGHCCIEGSSPRRETARTPLSPRFCTDSGFRQGKSPRNSNL